MTREELITVVESEIKDLASDLEISDSELAVNKALMETSYTLPNTDNAQSYWLIERTKRHLIFMLATGSARKFQVKQIKLSEKFKNLKELYVSMDSEWREAKRDLGIGVTDYSTLFGTKIDAGFSYDPVTAEDSTYNKEQIVIATPSDGS